MHYVLSENQFHCTRLTSGPMATTCGDVVSAEAGKEALERPKVPPPHVVCRTTTVISCTSDGWGFPRLDCLTAEPSSLGTPPALHVGVIVCMWRSNRWLN